MLNGTYTVTKGPRDKAWLASCTVDLAPLTSNIIERLALHGLHQKVADAASGATTEDEANAAMAKAADTILRGDWTSRVAGEGVDEETTVARAIIRTALKTSWGAKSPKWVAFTGLADGEQGEKLDTVRADNPGLFDDAIAAKLAERKRERETKAKLAKAIAINI